MVSEKNPYNSDDLERDDQWEFEAAEKRPGVSKARAVVSVAFARDDFELVSECAEKQGKKTSEFIREAALDKVVRSTAPIMTSSATGPAMVATHLSTAATATTERRDLTTVG